MVIDESRPFTSSKVAAGIINPVTGRRMVTSWMIDELMPFASNAYHQSGIELGIECIEEKSLIDFFPSAQMRVAFFDRLAENGLYLSAGEDSINWKDYVHYDFDYGVIKPCYLIDIALLLQTFRKRLTDANLLREEFFITSELVQVPDGIRYRDINAGKVIFCDGINSFHHPYFKALPFAPNKGEVLVVEIKDLPKTSILKKSINIVPLKNDLFWIGSSHEWQFENDQPTKLFREKTIAQLRSFLKLPFTVADHWAAIRPATLERRPFVGLHPLYPNIGIFNGMGTKGCSLGPYFAAQFAKHLTRKTPLLPQVDINRFKNILCRR